MNRNTKPVLKLTIGLCFAVVTGAMLFAVLLVLTTPVWYRAWPLALAAVIGLLVGPLLLKSANVSVRRFLIVLGWSFGVWSLFVPSVELFDNRALTWRGTAFALLGIVVMLLSRLAERTEFNAKRHRLRPRAKSLQR